MGVKWLQNAVNMISECQFNTLINMWREGNWSLPRSIDKIKWNRGDWRKDIWSSPFYAYSSRPSSIFIALYSLGKKGTRWNTKDLMKHLTVALARAHAHTLTNPGFLYLQLCLYGSPLTPEVYDGVVKGPKDKWSVKNCFSLQHWVTQSLS